VGAKVKNEHQGATRDRSIATSVGQVSGSGTSPAAAGALATAIQAGLSGAGVPVLTAGVQRLMAAYRSGENLATPALATRTDAAAYAAYRMPATAAAAGLALRQARLSLPGWRPATLLDFGAGTGSTAWAVATELPSVDAVILLEQSAAAIGIGRAILAAAEAARLPAATWRTWRLPAGRRMAGQSGEQPALDEPAAGPPVRSDDLPVAELPAVDMPAADIATISYVLGELTDAQQAAILALAVRAAPAVVLIEPGTPAGHRRILAARDRLLAAGYLLAAPCPHANACPLAAASDWCHFAARLPRSALHRQVKGAELSYEDEKFSYIAAVRPDATGPGAPPVPVLPADRIVRRPQRRKGLVAFELCRRDGSAGRQFVGKSAGASYREARKSSWGDRWEPPR
jgi:ribosomal protein RSM22 (predicted rRNA methylase)